MKYRFFSIGSLMAVFACSFIFAVMNYECSDSATVKPARGWQLMRIDGNRNGKYVEFSHEGHQKIALKAGAGCDGCHHMNMPGDRCTACYTCHKDMLKASSIFDHAAHMNYYKKTGYCNECHPDDRSIDNVKRCVKCHSDYTRDIRYYLSARSYTDSMHVRCNGCHQKEDAKNSEKFLSECGFCHQDEL